MKTINRTVVTVSPKQPYIDWANSFEANGAQIDPSETHTTAFLLSDDYNELNYENFIEIEYAKIFDLELESWMASPKHWPKNRSYKLFKEWFEVRVADTVFDLGIDKIEHEEY